VPISDTRPIFLQAVKVFRKHSLFEKVLSLELEKRMDHENRFITNQHTTSLIERTKNKAQKPQPV
jgi:hypothetical protein